MNTIIIEHADNKTTELLKQLATALGLSVQTKIEKEEEGVIKNERLKKVIEDYETGNAQTIAFDKSSFLK